MPKLQLLKCQNCGKYTLNEACACGGKAVSPKPPKYSPQDLYAKYRQEAKEEERIKKGLI